MSTTLPQPARSKVTLRLRKPLERSLRAGHPWVYRAALEPFEAPPGSIGKLLDKRGRFLARGWVESGPIGLRVLTTEDRPINAYLLRERMAQALSLRARLCPRDTDALRLIHGEGDRLPGVVVDRYAQYAVLRLDGEGALDWQPVLETLLHELLTPMGVESLLTRTGRKTNREVNLAWGPTPPALHTVQERGMRLCVNLWTGQKTGLFLDHRASRARVRTLCGGEGGHLGTGAYQGTDAHDRRDDSGNQTDERVAEGAGRVLNLYGYTGGFSIAAGLGGAAEVTTVDVAQPALALAEASWLANGLPPAGHRAVASDVPKFLQDDPRQPGYDIIISDPPNFAPSESARPAALQSYEALHRSVLDRLVPGGYYMAASCSSHITREDFEQTLLAAGGKARRMLQVLERSAAPFDHPRLLAFPEGDYLKVLLCRVVA